MTSQVGGNAPRSPSLSVVIPLYNGASTLPAQLAALATQTYAGDWELIISDNGSSDDGPALVDSWRGRIPNISIVDSSGRRGVSHARNIGARRAVGDVVLLCDADDVVGPGWLAAMAAASFDFDLVGGRLDETSLNEPWVAGSRPFTQDSRLPIGLGFLPYSAGANFAVRREIFDELGGWGEEFRGGGDDIDFCWRAQLAGYNLGFAPDAVIQYRHRSTPSGLRGQFFHYGMMEVLLYKRYASLGLGRSSVRTGATDLAWVVWHVRDRRGTHEQQGRWHRKAGHRLGRLRGSVRFRTVFL